MMETLHPLKRHIKNVDIIHTLLLFMLVVYPFIVIPGPLPYFYGPRYIILAAVSLLALTYLILKGFRFNIPADYPLLGFTIFLIISTLLSDNLATAWGGNSLRFTGASTYLFCIILYLLASISKSRQKLIEAMVVAAAVVSITAIMQNYGVNIVPHEAYRAGFRSYGTLGNANFLGTYAVFILPAAMMLYLHQKKYMWLFCSALIFSALIVSFTRGAWLAFAAVFLLFIYYIIRNPHLIKQMIVLILVFISIYSFLSFTTERSVSDRAASVSDEIANVAEYTDTSASIRVFVWQESLGIITNNWAFGVGADNLQVPVPRGYIEDKAFNIFLEIAVTMGIFALSSYLLFLYYCLRKQEVWFKTLLLFMIIAYVLQGQFNIDVIMNMPLFWITLGLTQVNSVKSNKVISLYSTSNKENSVIRKSKIIRHGLIILIIIFLFIAALLYYLPRQGVVDLNGQGAYEGQIRGLYTMHGQGKLVMESGSIYQGSFRHGYFDGFGVLSFPDGSKYVGEFRQGFFHGEGKLVSPDGEITEGEWEMGDRID